MQATDGNACRADSGSCYIRKGNRPEKMLASLFERARRRHHAGNAALGYDNVRTLIAPPEMKQPPAARRYFLQMRFMSAKARAAITPHTEPPHRHSAASGKPTGIFSRPYGCTCPEPRQNPAHIRQLPYSTGEKARRFPRPAMCGHDVSRRGFPPASPRFRQVGFGQNALPFPQQWRVPQEFSL